jgi:hypothetical protein
MSDLFNRDFSMLLGGVPLPIQSTDLAQSDKIQPALKVEFSIEKNSNKDPNIAEVIVYNFNPINRSTLQQGSKLVETLRQATPPKLYDWPIVIEAGYVGFKELLFTGNITFANSRKEKTTWVTDIEAGDGEKQYRKSRINKSFGPGTNILTAATQTAALMGVGPGNLATKLGPGIFRKGYGVFAQGVTLSGRASNALDKMLSSAGFTWSIQDGQLLILAPNETTVEEVVVISNKLGNLIGSPEKGDEGSITIRSLLQGKLKPGRRLLLESNMITGFFKIEKVIHFGDTWGNDWYTEVEAKPL